jgi:hypothetical protein
MAIEVSFAEDVFVPNKLMIQLPRPVGSQIALAAIRFEAHAGAWDSREAVRRCCMEAALHQLPATWPKMPLWAFVCHSTWQPKGRLSLYRGLWKSLETATIKIPSGERSREIKVESADGVRFFGAVNVPFEEKVYAWDVLQAQPESFLVGCTNGDAPPLDDELLRVWEQRRQSRLAIWAELAVIVCRGGRVLLRPFGYFDDVEVGVDLFLESSLLGQWNAARHLIQEDG